MILLRGCERGLRDRERERRGVRDRERERFRADPRDRERDGRLFLPLMLICLSTKCDVVFDRSRRFVCL